MDDLPICVTCGVQFPADHDTAHCPICEDDRQYIGHDGQQWTTLGALRTERRNRFADEVYGLTGIGMTPRFAIGQRALLVPGEGGNLLWDCVSLIDDETVQKVNELGGIAAIAISHPHYYSSMIEWSEAFGGVPIYLHNSDRQWVQRGGNVVFWEGDRQEVLPGRTLLNPRIHFAGGSIVHWADGAQGRGALCTGDIFQVVADRRWLSFMYSYPNYIPEHPDTVRRSLQLVEPFDFDVIYGAWWEMVVQQDAKAALTRSARRYLEHLGMQL